MLGTAALVVAHARAHIMYVHGNASWDGVWCPEAHECMLVQTSLCGFKFLHLYLNDSNPGIRILEYAIGFAKA